MEQDKAHWPKDGPTGDAVEDERRRKEQLAKLKRIVRENSCAPTDDLFPDAGRMQLPDKKMKYFKDRKIVRYAFALGLDDQIPEKLVEKYLGPEPMADKDRQEFMKKYPPRHVSKKEMQDWAKKHLDDDIPF